LSDVIDVSLSMPWNTTKFKYVASMQKGHLPKDTTAMPESESDIPYLSMEYLREQTTTPSYVSPQSNLVLAEDGDILLLWDGANAGEFMRAKRGVVSSTAARVAPRGVHHDYLFWACKVLETAIRSETVGMGIPHVNGDFLGNIKLHIPLLREQQTIADYLDRETAKIDAMIVAKERLLELLAEKRRALITHAVTRGLNPNVILRNSGFPWLGKIPAHWRLVKLKYISQIYYGLSQPTEYKSDGLPFVRATNVKQGQLVRGGIVFVDEADLSDTRAVRLRIGDIIVVRSGAYTGDSALVTQEWAGSIAGYDMVVRLIGETIPSFVGFAMLCPHILEAQIDPLRIRAAQPHLNAEELGDVSLLLPPVDEQEAIVASIKYETTKLDALKVTAEWTIGLLKERRAALISAAVTGKIRTHD